MVIQYLLGGAVVLFLVTLVFGAITHRVKLRSCCAVADPSRDLRMQASELEG